MENKENEYEYLTTKNYYYSLALEGYEDYVNFIFKKVHKTWNKLDNFRKAKNSLSEEEQFDLAKEIANEFEEEAKKLLECGFCVEEDGYVCFDDSVRRNNNE